MVATPIAGMDVAFVGGPVSPVVTSVRRVAEHGVGGVCLLPALVAAVLLLATPPARAGTVNFDGMAYSNRVDELAAWDPGGRWYAKSPDGRVVLNSVAWGSDQTTPVPGDYDGDGETDLGLYRRDTGTWMIHRRDGSVITSGVNWGWVDAVPCPADFDGDGRTDLAVFFRETGNWYVRTLGGQTLAFGVNWGWDETVPVPADYDGDGQAELAVYHRHTGNWYAKALDGRTTVFAENWGWIDTIAVPGDYDGDSRTELAVYDRLRGDWYVRRRGGAVLAFRANWGWRETVAVPGDYDGDGALDMAVYHRKSGNWFARALDGRVLLSGVNWGWSGTAPLHVYARRSADGLNVLCLGDSITYGEGTSSDGPATAYAILLERKNEVYLGGDYRFLNAGLPGERTGGGVARLPGLLDRYHPDVLLLMEGTNDALSDQIFEGGTERNLKNMILAAQARGVAVVIATIPPVISDSHKDRTLQMERIQDFNPTIVSLAQRYGTGLANVYSAITSQPNWAATLMNPSSGNHPNSAGHLRIRDTFFAEVRKLMLDGTAY